MALSVLSLLVACGAPASVTPPSPTPPASAPVQAATPGARGLVVEGVPVPVGDATRQVVAATSGTLDGVPFSFGFQPIARTGDVIGGVVFGARASRSGADLGLCEGLDYTGIWPSAAGLSMVTHFECQPAAMYLTALAQDRAGRLSPTATRRVDASAVDGGNYFCAGSETSWDSHLAGEEYEGDVRKLLPDGTLSDNFEDYNEMARWWDGDLAKGHPWLYGWMVEAPSSGPATRRWSMGRFSHEIAVVMPDDRTVYLTDDTANASGSFLFQADAPGDLSAGTLYAARWAAEGEGYAVTWVSLGHATDAEVEAAVARRPAFTDLFDVAEPTGTTCPAGLTFVRVSWGPECLAVRPGMEAVASRVESRRVAGLKGATTEFIKTEGLAFAPERSQLFVAMTRVDKGVTGGDPTWDLGGRDDLRVPKNPCGVVWALDVGAGPAGGPAGDFVATHASIVVAGRPQGAVCADDGLANPDNLAWIPGTSTLAIAEDSHLHANDALWLYDLGKQQLTRVLTAPVGAEVSGLRWTAGVGGFDYLSVSIQHPFSDGGGATPDERRSTAGVLGPFPSAAPRAP